MCLAIVSISKLISQLISRVIGWLRARLRRLSTLGSRRRDRLDVASLPKPLLDAELYAVAGQLFAVEREEIQDALKVVHAFYVVIGGWHRRRPETRTVVYRAAAAHVEHRLVHGVEPVHVETEDAATDLDADERRAVASLVRQMVAAVDRAREAGASATACRGACRLLRQILVAD